jgi:hypothetical protein
MPAGDFVPTGRARFGGVPQRAVEIKDDAIDEREGAV